MASEALVTDQTTDKHIEETVTGNTKIIDEESTLQAKDVTQKNEEEKIERDDSTSTPAVIEEKQEVKGSDNMVEQLKIEEDEDTDKHLEEVKVSAEKSKVPSLAQSDDIEGRDPSEADEKQIENLEVPPVQDSESEATKGQVVLEPAIGELESAEVGEASVAKSSEFEIERKLEEVKKEDDTANGVEEVRNSTQDSDFSIPSEPAGEVREREPSAAEEKSEILESPPVQESESKATEEPVVEKSSVDPKSDGKSEEFVKDKNEGGGMGELVTIEADDSLNVDVSLPDKNSIGEIAGSPVKREVDGEEEKQEPTMKIQEPTTSELSEINIGVKVDEILYEGEKAVGGADIIDENKDKGLNVVEVPNEVAEKDADGKEGGNSSSAEISSDIDAGSKVVEVSLGGEKVSEGVDLSEEKDESLKNSFDVAEFSSKDKDENLGGEKTTLVETSEDLSASAEVAKASSEQERASEGAAMVEVKKDKLLEDEKKISIETSKDLDGTTEVVEASPEGVEISKENTDGSLGGDKTLSETTQELNATTEVTEVSTKGEKPYGDAQMAEGKKDESPGAEMVGVVKTSKDLSAATEVAESAEMVEENRDKSLDDEKATLLKTSADLDITEVSSEAAKASGSDEMVEEKKDGSLELQSDKPTLVDTAKDDDVDEKNVVATSATEVVAGPEKVESDAKPGEAIETASEEKREVKIDDQNIIASFKESDDTKETKEASPKQEVPAKTPHRHSNSMLSKVKHSLVKAKKAIFGKSPSSRTISSEGK